MTVTTDMLEAARQVLIPELKELKDRIVAMDARLSERMTGLEGRVEEMSRRLGDHSARLHDHSRQITDFSRRIDDQTNRLNRVLEGQNELIIKIGEWLATSHADLQDLKYRVEALERKVA